MIPVSKSAAAKPTTKNEVGVRKVLKGSFQIASSKRPFPTAVTALIKERKIPDAIFIRRKILVRYLSSNCDEFVEFILGEKRHRCVLSEFHQEPISLRWIQN